MDSLQMIMDQINGIHMLSIGQSTQGASLHPVIVIDNDSITLIDGGMPGQMGDLRQEMDRYGVSPEMITHIILTHQDFDHIGGIPDILQKLDKPATVYAHADEKPYIEGARTSIKQDPEIRRQMQDNLPAGEILPPAHKPPKTSDVPVDVTISDGDILPLATAVQVIHTPGHTPGHISLYLPQSKTLISGDALNVEDNDLCGPAPIHSVDIHMARRTLAKLAGLDIERIICYHGGQITSDAAFKLNKLADLA